MKNKCIYGLLVGAMMAGACPVWGETVVGETVFYKTCCRER